MIDPTPPFGPTPVAGVAARGANPPETRAMATLRLHPHAHVIWRGAGGHHLNRLDIVVDGDERNNPGAAQAVVGRSAARSTNRLRWGRNANAKPRGEAHRIVEDPRSLVRGAAARLS